MKFLCQYEDAAAVGMHLTAHCDINQKDSIEHIRQALEIRKAERIDLDVSIVEDSDFTDFVVNSFGASWMSGEKTLYLAEIDAYVAKRRLALIAC